MRPVQMKVEEASLKAIERQVGGDERVRHAVARLLVWSVRGLTIELLMNPDPKAADDAVDVLRLLLQRSASTGWIDDLPPALFRDDPASA
ncbi:hypothetical protein AB5I41_10965 [Sphingomonas sp. MMS24-JH45]